MRLLRRTTLVLGYLLIVPRLAAPSQAAVADRIEELTLRVQDRRLILEARTSAPALPFVCRTPMAGRSDLLIEWPGASSALPGRIPLGDERAPEAFIETGAGGAPGVRVRVPLRGLRLTGVEQSDAGLRIFLDAEGASGGAGGEYELSVGDKIAMSVFGQDDLDATLEVRLDGTVDFPLIGARPVAGKSVEAVDAEITEILGRDFLVDPQVTIEIKESARLWVTIMGEVRAPGRYALKREMRLIDLLAEADGLTKEAGSRILVTRRDGAGSVRTIPVTVDRLFSEHNNEANLSLERNDIVTVGGKEYYYIRGEVVRPGPYYLESGTTVLKAVSVAGGFTQFGNRRQVELLRPGQKGLQEKTLVSLKAIEEGKIPDVPVLPDDTIIVLKKVF